MAKAYSVPYGIKVSVSIRREGGTAYVDVLAPLYINEKWTMTHCYSASFSDDEILRDRDFVSKMIKHYPSQER